MADAPDPPIPPHIDVRDLDGFMLNVERLMASELVALSSHEVVGAALFLWCRAWKQVPAASLPDDERVIAAYSGLKPLRFRALRDQVMHGFVKCSDGRWYHRVLALEAFSAFGRKQSFQKKREADAERLRKWRESKRETPDETPSETHDETRFVAEGQGQGQGQGQGHIRTSGGEPTASTGGIESTDAPASPTPPAKGRRLPKTWVLPKAWGEWAKQEKPHWPDAYIRQVAEKFKDHWVAQPGQKGIKLDWEATWRNWVRNEADPKNGAASKADKPWFLTAPGVEAKGRELGFDNWQLNAIDWNAQRDKVYAAAGITPEMVRKARIDAGERV